MRHCACSACTLAFLVCTHACGQSRGCFVLSQFPSLAFCYAGHVPPALAANSEPQTCRALPCWCQRWQRWACRAAMHARACMRQCGRSLCARTQWDRESQHESALQQGLPSGMLTGTVAIARYSQTLPLLSDGDGLRRGRGCGYGRGAHSVASGDVPGTFRRRPRSRWP